MFPIYLSLFSNFVIGNVITLNLFALTFGIASWLLHFHSFFAVLLLVYLFIALSIIAILIEKSKVKLFAVSKSEKERQLKRAISRRSKDYFAILCTNYNFADCTGQRQYTRHPLSLIKIDREVINLPRTHVAQNNSNTKKKTIKKKYFLIFPIRGFYLIHWVMVTSWYTVGESNFGAIKFLFLYSYGNIGLLSFAPQKFITLSTLW